MKRAFQRFTPSVLTACALVMAVGGVAPEVARADVERIREKALELEQKLNKHQYEVEVRGEAPNTERIYKDFAFLLKKSQIEEAESAAGSDPNAEALRLFLIEATVAMELASFRDELREFEQNNTLELEGGELSYTDLLKRLALASESGDRRKLYNALGAILETTGVFQTEILQRRNDNLLLWGFDNYATFFAAREHIDLDEVIRLADGFLDDSQALYDSLFVMMASRYLGVEARKVRFYDLPYLTLGGEFDAALPATERMRRMRSVFKGLGIDLGDQDNLGLDDEARVNKRLAPGVFPVLVPDDIRVSVNPMGGLRDDDDLIYAIGSAQVFSLSKQTMLESGYLVNGAAQATLAFLPRLVLDEPTWVDKMAKKDLLDSDRYLPFRAFRSLYEARMLAAMAKVDIESNRGAADIEALFRKEISRASGARLSSSDAKNAFSYLTDLHAASRFLGLLNASALRDHLRDELGADWYDGGKAGATLAGLAAMGGELNLEAIAARAGDITPSSEGFLAGIERLMSAASESGE